ncbi:MAG: AAA family ATPase [Candidatus Acidiferrales bacterium]
MNDLPIVIVLVGVPGSGKSTWAYRNARDAIIASQDDLIDAITPSGFDFAACPIYAAAEEATARAALEYGRHVIVDRTNRTCALRRRWLSIAQEAKCPAIAVVMSADWDTCRRRNRERSGSRRVCEERLDRMIAAFEQPNGGEGFHAVVDDRDCKTVLDAIRAAKLNGSTFL